MLLQPHEALQFFKLHRTLMFYVNERLRVLPLQIASPEGFAGLPPANRLKVRDAFLKEANLIESFVKENPAKLSSEELDIVRSWRHFVAGTFYLFRELKKYTIFLSAEDPPITYGVTALTEPFGEMLEAPPPVIVRTVLLPFRGKLIYDGLLSGPGLSVALGAGIRRELNERYREAKDRQVIVTSLPVDERSRPAKKVMSTKKKDLNVDQTEDIRGIANLIIGMIDEFCREHLNDEYAVLCRKLAEKLARKRPSPLQSGKPNVWACGIVRTIGQLNFLGDRSQTPHMKISDISRAFGVGESTASAKSATIRGLLRINNLDTEWMLPSLLEENPLAWMLKVNGFLMDIRDAPREVQEVAFEQGLIPYIPADRTKGE